MTISTCVNSLTFHPYANIANANRKNLKFLIKSDFLLFLMYTYKNMLHACTMFNAIKSLYK